jgi:ribosome-associated protein
MNQVKPSSPKPADTSSTPRETLPPEKQVLHIILQALEDLKGKDIVELDVRELTDITDTLVIVSGTSNRHVKSLADKAIRELKQSGCKVYGVEGQDAGEWVLVDAGNVILHVMQPATREFYDLERLWSLPAVLPQ